MFRQPNGPERPLISGRMLSSGTNTWSMTIWPVGEARIENLPSIFGVDSPSIPRSRRKPRMTPSSLAQTTITPAMGELVIHDLVPVST